MRHVTKTHLLSGLLAGAAASMLAALLLIGGAGAQDSAEVEGRRYVMHALKPPADAFDNDPSSFDRVIARHVEQGPEHTLMWGVDLGEEARDRASFARGEERMGLFLPNWELGRPSSEDGAWTWFGTPMEYDLFDVEVTRGDEDRTIMGRTASHYVLDAHIAWTDAEYVGPDMSSWPHKRVRSDLWILEDEPFGFAPFSIDAAYGDPRLSAALTEELGALGMVVRVETVYSMWGEDAEGNHVGDPLDGTHLAWVSDLEARTIASPGIPMATYAQLSALRAASRENPEQTCETVMAGDTPGFVSAELDAEQARVFVENLAERCGER